jgi:two-component system alkaline phosphatase synthesis response regulator PhoP
MAGRTILIADDEPHLVHILAYNLTRAGAVVEIATNGQECVEIALRIRPDLIVSDYQMPVLDGLQASIQLRSNLATTHIPILMLTSRGHRLTPAELALTNIRAVMAKPFSIRQLLKSIEDILSKPSTGTVAA